MNSRGGYLNLTVDGALDLATCIAQYNAPNALQQCCAHYRVAISVDGIPTETQAHDLMIKIIAYGNAADLGFLIEKLDKNTC